MSFILYVLYIYRLSRLTPIIPLVAFLRHAARPLFSLVLFKWFESIFIGNASRGFIYLLLGALYVNLLGYLFIIFIVYSARSLANPRPPLPPLRLTSLVYLSGIGDFSREGGRP